MYIHTYVHLFRARTKAKLYKYEQIFVNNTYALLATTAGGKFIVTTRYMQHMQPTNIAHMAFLLITSKKKFKKQCRNRNAK